VKHTVKAICCHVHGRLFYTVSKFIKCCFSNIVRIYLTKRRSLETGFKLVYFQLDLIQSKTRKFQTLKSSKVKEREIEVEEEKMCFKFIFKERETAKRIKMSLGVNFTKVLQAADPKSAKRH